jgi:hypothetical protein
MPEFNYTLIFCAFLISEVALVKIWRLPWRDQFLWIRTLCRTLFVLVMLAGIIAAIAVACESIY